MEHECSPDTNRSSRFGAFYYYLLLKYGSSASAEQIEWDSKVLLWSSDDKPQGLPFEGGTSPGVPTREVIDIARLHGFWKTPPRPKMPPVPTRGPKFYTEAISGVPPPLVFNDTQRLAIITQLGSVHNNIHPPGNSEKFQLAHHSNITDTGDGSYPGKHPGHMPPQFISMTQVARDDPKQVLSYLQDPTTFIARGADHGLPLADGAVGNFNLPLASSQIKHLPATGIRRPETHRTIVQRLSDQSEEQQPRSNDKSQPPKTPFSTSLWSSYKSRVEPNNEECRGGQAKIIDREAENRKCDKDQEKDIETFPEHEKYEQAKPPETLSHKAKRVETRPRSSKSRKAQSRVVYTSQTSPYFSNTTAQHEKPQYSPGSKSLISAHPEEVKSSSKIKRVVIFDKDLEAFLKSARKRILVETTASTIQRYGGSQAQITMPAAHAHTFKITGSTSGGSRSSEGNIMNLGANTTGLPDQISNELSGAQESGIDNGGARETNGRKRKRENTDGELV